MLAQANRVLWLVDQSVPSCKKGLERLRRLRERSPTLPRIELLIERYWPSVPPDSAALGKMFGLELFGVLPASPEARLRAKNIGQSLFDLSPRDPLTVKLRDLADNLGANVGERPRRFAWLGWPKAVRS